MTPDDIEMDDKDQEPNSDSEEEDYDEEVEGGRGVDNLRSSNRFDIPRVNDIPVVSSLAK